MRTSSAYLCVRGSDDAVVFADSGSLSSEVAATAADDGHNKQLDTAAAINGNNL